MKYFKNITSIENLKTAYKKLARVNHPDMGGDVEVMKAINAEFDILFAALPKVKTNTETANNFRTTFYSQNGWQGSNYNASLSLKEIAVLVRNFCKTVYPECKFSVTTHYASMCRSLDVALVESPYKCNKTVEELSQDELYDSSYSYNYTHGRETNDSEKQWFLKNCYSNEITAILKDVDRFVNSYNYDDSDSMTDYFDVNFYYSKAGVGKWDKPYVQNEARMAKKRKLPTETVCS